jgi:hypothetical protein
VNWQVTLGLCLYVGWLGLHSWLGKKQLAIPLAGLIGAEVLAFAGTWFWIAAQDYNASAGMAVGFTILGAAAIFLVPAMIGAFSLFRHRTTAL